MTNSHLYHAKISLFVFISTFPGIFCNIYASTVGHRWLCRMHIIGNKIQSIGSPQGWNYLANVSGEKEATFSNSWGHHPQHPWRNVKYTWRFLPAMSNSMPGSCSKHETCSDSAVTCSISCTPYLVGFTGLWEEGPRESVMLVEESQKWQNFFFLPRALCVSLSLMYLGHVLGW